MTDRTGASQIKDDLIDRPFLRTTSARNDPLLTEFAQIIRKHLSPPDPVVVDVMTPDVEAVWDAF